MSDILNRREALATALALTVLPAAQCDDKPPANALVVVVLDPLAASNSCSCVKGYAQRDYDPLGKHIATKLGRPVVVAYGMSLAGALAKKTDGRADLVIGKDAVVKATAGAHKLTVDPLAALTDREGKTTQTGLICVAASDPAVTAGDLNGYTIYFGPAPSEEKHAAAVEVFKDVKVKLPAKLDICDTCADSAKKVVDEAKGGKKVATVISSYAHPLLEGCGTIKKGELRVVGDTEPVPFITAFATNTLSLADRDVVKAALLDAGKSKDMLAALESKGGFVALDAKKK